LRWLAAQGWVVTGIDRDPAAVQALCPQAEVVVADLEAGPWPLPDRRYDGIVVTNYLWRPLWPVLRGALAPGGVLICETFARGQASIGRPSRPEFLLAPGELLAACEGLRVVAFEDGYESDPPRFVQRIAAVREAPGAAPSARYALACAPAPAEPAVVLGDLSIPAQPDLPGGRRS
jgi:SAM-dependent methyltransferase